MPRRLQSSRNYVAWAHRNGGQPCGPGTRCWDPWVGDLLFEGLNYLRKLMLGMRYPIVNIFERLQCKYTVYIFVYMFFCAILYIPVEYQFL